MRFTMKGVLWASLALLVVGCLPLSTGPLYSGEDDLVFREALLGTWEALPREEDDARSLFDWDPAGVVGRWTVRRMPVADSDELPRPAERAPGGGVAGRQSEGKLYKITSVDEEGRKAVFAGGLVQVGDRLFLDLFPMDIGDAAEGDDALGLNLWLFVHMASMHSFMQVRLRDDGLAIAACDMDALTELLKTQPNLVEHVWVRGAPDEEHPLPLLTAKAEDLQAFIREHLDDERFFPEWLEMQRVEPVATQPAKTQPADGR